MIRWGILYMLDSTWGHIRHDWLRFTSGNLFLSLALAVAGLWSGLYTSFTDQWTGLTTVKCLVYLKDGIEQDAAAGIINRVWKPGPDMKWTFISEGQDREENRVLLKRLAPGMALDKGGIGAAHIEISARLKSPEDLSRLQDRISRLSATRGVDFVVAPPMSGSGVGLSWMVGGMQTVGWIAIIMMFLIAVFVVSDRMRWVMRDRKTEADVIRYFGGTNNFYRIPILIEGLAGGILAGLIGFLLAWIGWNFSVGVLWSTYSVDLAIHGAPFKVFAWIAAGGPVGGITAFFLSGVMERW